jgi:GDPmannose 4,6-dehydratase
MVDRLASIQLIVEKELRLINIDTKRNWGYSNSYVKALWLTLEQDVPDDNLIATNQTITLRDIRKIVFAS